MVEEEGRSDRKEKLVKVRWHGNVMELYSAQGVGETSLYTLQDQLRMLGRGMEVTSLFGMKKKRATDGRTDPNMLI